jgi:DNA-binding NtrC family response regulator
MERAAVIAPGPRVGAADLSLGAPARPGGDDRALPDRRRLSPATSATEQERILQALQQTHGNQTDAAELLGISRRTLLRRLDEYQVPRPRKG